MEKGKADKQVDSVTDYVEDKEIGDESTSKESLAGLQQKSSPVEAWWVNFLRKFGVAVLIVFLKVSS